MEYAGPDRLLPPNRSTAGYQPKHEQLDRQVASIRKYSYRISPLQLPHQILFLLIPHKECCCFVRRCLDMTIHLQE